MDIEKLIHCLQCCARVDAHNIGCDDCGLEYCGPECQQLCGTAAIAISTLQAENERLRAELNDLKSQWDMYGGDVGITAVYKELEQAKRERDAIEQDFRAFAKQWWEQDSGFPCRWCKFEKSEKCEWKSKHQGQICAGRAFEWCGPQKED